MLRLGDRLGRVLAGRAFVHRADVSGLRASTPSRDRHAVAPFRLGHGLQTTKPLVKGALRPRFSSVPTFGSPVGSSTTGLRPAAARQRQRRIWLRVGTLSFCISQNRCTLVGCEITKS